MKNHKRDSIEFVNASSRCIVEYGRIRLRVGDTLIDITIEQSSDGFEDFLLDDIEHKNMLIERGVEFQGDDNIIGPTEFIDDLYTFYTIRSNDRFDPRWENY